MTLSIDLFWIARLLTVNFQADSKAAERVAAVRQHTDDEPTPETSAKALEPLVLSLVSMIQCVEMYCRYVYGHVRAAHAQILDSHSLLRSSP